MMRTPILGCDIVAGMLVSLRPDSPPLRVEDWFVEAPVVLDMDWAWLVLEDVK